MLACGCCHETNSAGRRFDFGKTQIIMPRKHWLRTMACPEKPQHLPAVPTVLLRVATPPNLMKWRRLSISFQIALPR